VVRVVGGMGSPHAMVAWATTMASHVAWAQYPWLIAQSWQPPVQSVVFAITYPRLPKEVGLIFHSSQITTELSTAAHVNAVNFD
jgi:hypothetical protein